MSAQVWLELSAEDLQGGTLSNTVGSDKTQDLARSGHRQTMQLEAVGAITVGDLALEVGGQVDDGDGLEGALLGADTTTNAERLGDEGQAIGRGDLNAELSAADNGARLFALLTTFSGATLRGGGGVSMYGGAKVEGGDRVGRTLSLLTIAILLIFASVTAIPPYKAVVGLYLPRELVRHGCNRRLMKKSSECECEVGFEDLVGVFLFNFRKSGTKKTGLVRGGLQHRTRQHGRGLRARGNEGHAECRTRLLTSWREKYKGKGTVKTCNKELWRWCLGLLLVRGHQFFPSCESSVHFGGAGQWGKCLEGKCLGGNCAGLE